MFPNRHPISLLIVVFCDIIAFSIFYQSHLLNANKHIRAREYFETNLRWFIIHAMINVIIFILSIPGFVAFLNNPFEAFISDDKKDLLFSSTSKWPLTLTIWLHFYHILGKFKLSNEDWFHHLIFISTLALPGMIYDWGCFSNYFAVFVCGLPGAVDYFLLAMQKIGYLQSWNQKRISANLNVWMRMPGVIFGIGIGYLLFRKNMYFVPSWALTLQLFLMPLNAIYYSKQSVINYVLHTVKSYIPDNRTWKELKRL